MSWAAVTLSVAMEVRAFAVVVMVEGVDPPRTQNYGQLIGTQSPPRRRSTRCRPVTATRPTASRMRPAAPSAARSSSISLAAGTVKRTTMNGAPSLTFRSVAST